MAKYSFKFKKEVVLVHLNGEGGKNFIAEKYGIPAPGNVKKWADNYKRFGDEELLRSHQNEEYSFEYKLHVVELYLSSEISYQELALQEGIIHLAQITKWVNDFRLAGSDTLRRRKKDRKKTLNKSETDKVTQSAKETLVDTSAKYVKELEDEILKLREIECFLYGSLGISWDLFIFLLQGKNKLYII